ncbi:probable cytochrome P450 6u1 [Teleopsis dalmanni]|uniref:probable cytochrome P450 6u1 n=1 Tax=Teleopsis dalmanni TaxID=139649 RepID=UPI0018CF9CF6|nr:probable cytochrome P450 6u1 [Teleopsis dalmanni]
MDLLHRLLYTTIGALSIFYLLVKYSLSHWKKRGILHEKPKFLWGNLKGVGSKKHIQTALQEHYNKYKAKAPFIGFYAYVKPVILLLDLDVIKYVLQTDAHIFKARGLYNNVESDPLSQNLFQLDGHKWEELHNKLRIVFSKEKLESIVPALLNISTVFKRSLNERLSSRKIFVINDLVDSFNVDVIANLVFNMNSDSLLHPNTEFRAMTQTYMKSFSMIKAYLATYFPIIARILGYRSYDELVTNYYCNLVKNKVIERKKQHSQPHNDFLEIFAKLKYEDNSQGGFSFNELTAQAFSFVLAGLQTCNTTMIYCLYELSVHPQMQDKARAEINDVLKKHNNQINMKSISDMQYLNQIVCETLRKHSPYPFLLRKTTKDYEIPDSVFMFKEDNYLVVPISAIHHDPDIYPEPGRFDPDRFLPSEVQKRHPFTWIPFGFGPRECIAQEFAKIQILVGLITLLQDYKYSSSTEVFTPIDYDNTNLFILRPKLDINLCVERVEH